MNTKSTRANRKQFELHSAINKINKQEYIRSSVNSVAQRILFVKQIQSVTAMTQIQMQTQSSYILAIQLNVGHTTVRYRTVVTQAHTDYTGEAEKVKSEENKGVTLKRSPYSGMKYACIKQCPC